jgi:tRNA(fMet)-specific endonuclease VapC
MDKAILDSDMLSEVLKDKNPQVAQHARQYLSQHGRLAFSAISYYEILRGIMAKQALQQLSTFERTASTAEILSVSIAVLRRAAELWATATAGGHPRDDADLMIAATALEVGRVLVTGNTQHFAWIPGLRIEDWRQL